MIEAPVVVRETRRSKAAGLKMQEEATSQGIKMASRSQKIQELIKGTKENLDFSPVKLVSDF